MRILEGRGPLVVGILNATPDSFYDGGVGNLIARGESMIGAGADWLDVGGASSRPGATPVEPEEEWRRVRAVVEAFSGQLPLSIDTTNPTVAARALRSGARILNDIGGLTDPEMVAVSAEAEVTIVMHMRGDSRSMGSLTGYGDLLAEVREHLLEAAGRARSAGVMIDPGLGFAKSASQNLSLLRHLDLLVDTGLPVLVGASRKSFIGAALDQPRPDQRLTGSLGAVAAAWARGARAFRVHDVEETRQLVDMLVAVDRAD